MHTVKRPPGQEPGHAAGDLAEGLDWGSYVAWLVERQGSLAAVAERLSAHRAYRDDAASVERALRRLRTRGRLTGGLWGDRALACFGLPGAVEQRARWMGAYHSRFTDLPVAVCDDLLRKWEAPPAGDAPGLRAWFALAWATRALRVGDRALARVHLQRARGAWAHAPGDARVELVLAEAFVASRDERALVPAMLDRAEALLAEVPAGEDALCLRARLADQRAYELNHAREDRGPDHRAAEALYLALPEQGPPFATCRKHSGLAYAAWKLGRRDEAIEHAKRAATWAGDGGHLRLRAMALQMLARVAGERTDEGAAAHERAVALARSLDDEALRLRFERDQKLGTQARANE